MTPAIFGLQRSLARRRIATVAYPLLLSLAACNSLFGLRERDYAPDAGTDGAAEPETGSVSADGGDGGTPADAAADADGSDGTPGDAAADVFAIVVVYEHDEKVDLNGDGKEDVCGRDDGGPLCAVSSGSALGASTRWTTSYSDADGWGQAPEYWATIRFPDLDGDGKTDVCGRAPDGILCARSSGTAFGATTLWSTSYGDAGGWNDFPQYWSTIRFADINGDGKADVCGRRDTGLLCALSSGSAFDTPTLWTTDTAMRTSGTMAPSTGPRFGIPT
jgi:hypothetical protein